LGRDFPSRQFAESAVEALNGLLASPLTVIHGEYYSHNILVSRGTIHPIDWESAALAAGEIDLAMLTEKWAEEVRIACDHAYCIARWPDRRPETITARLQLAQLYVEFRWLGESADHWWKGRIDNLRQLGEELCIG
jgi:thiamine kinase-like enzyme